MIQIICRDPFLLAQKAREAVPEDISIGIDLAETLNDHRHECVGMAANMIGHPVSIIAIAVNGPAMVMYNPSVIHHEGAYQTEEGCLSLSGTRPVTRYRKIRVRWQDQHFRCHEAVFNGFPAQVIQHEVDHLAGILI